MLFSTKAEYGVRLMVELGAARRTRAATSRSRSRAVAEAETLPLSYLEHLVAKLRQAGLVDSVRGAHGGYRLARPAAEIDDARRGPGARGPDRADGVLPRRARGPGPVLARDATAIAPAPRSFSGRGSTAGSRRRWRAPPWPNWSSSRRARPREPVADRPLARSPDNQPDNGDRWPIWRSETCT